MLKIALDTLKDCPGGFNYSWWDITSGGGWGGLAHGATTTMYYGSHRGTNNSFTVYYVPDNVNLLFTATNNIPAFTFQNRDSNCPVGGTNPCGRSDSRIHTGWVRKGSNQSVGEVGFMWDAHEGGFFSWSYTEAVTLREDNLTVTGRPYIAYGNGGVQYPGVSPNAQGDLGLTIYLMGGDYNKDVAFYVADDYEGMWTYRVWLGLSNGSATPGATTSGIGRSCRRRLDGRAPATHWRTARSCRVCPSSADSATHRASTGT
jgi:hypothetical protein